MGRRAAPARTHVVRLALGALALPAPSGALAEKLAPARSVTLALAARSVALGALALAARSLALGALGLGLALAVPALALAQGPPETPHQAVERVHREGRYPSDVIPLLPDSSGGSASDDLDAEGGGRGPRGETILGDREAGEAGRDSTAAARILRQIGEWLAGALSAIGGPLGWALLALGIAFLAVMAGFLLSGLRLGIGPGTLEGRAGSGQAEIDPMLLAPELSADELAAQRRWGEAIHALFVGALSRIGGQEGRLRGRTARELVLAVPPSQPGREELGELLDITEIVWFGARSASEEQYLHARALASRVGERDRPPETDEEEAA